MKKFSYAIATADVRTDAIDPSVSLIGPFVTLEEAQDAAEMLRYHDFTYLKTFVVMSMRRPTKCNSTTRRGTV